MSDVLDDWDNIIKQCHEAVDRWALETTHLLLAGFIEGLYDEDFMA